MTEISLFGIVKRYTHVFKDRKGKYNLVFTLVGDMPETGDDNHVSMKFDDLYDMVAFMYLTVDQLAEMDHSGDILIRKVEK